MFSLLNLHRRRDALPRELWARVAVAEPPLKTLLGALRGAIRAGVTLARALGVGARRGDGVTAAGRDAMGGRTVIAGRTMEAGWAGVGRVRCKARCTSARLSVEPNTFLDGAGAGCLPIAAETDTLRAVPGTAFATVAPCDRPRLRWLTAEAVSRGAGLDATRSHGLGAAAHPAG